MHSSFKTYITLCNSSSVRKCSEEMVPKQMGVKRKGVLALVGETVSVMHTILVNMYEYYNPELKEDLQGG